LQKRDLSGKIRDNPWQKRLKMNRRGIVFLLTEQKNKSIIYNDDYRTNDRKFSVYIQARNRRRR